MKEAASQHVVDSGREELDFEEMVQQHRPRIFRFALASLRDRDAAETVTQDCLLRACMGQQKFRGDCSLQTWLMQIAVNLVHDHLRNRRLTFWRRSMVQAPPESWASTASRDHTPESAAALRQEVEAVWRAAEKLPARQKVVFLLRFMEGLDILEIAAVAGMKEGTVKAHLFRALASVREELGMRR